jgi:hypothetical protein
MRRPYQLVPFGKLILRQRLRGKQIERPRRRIPQDRAQDGRVVAERLARRGRSGNDDVAAGERMLDRRGLMRVEPIDTAGSERRPQPVVDTGWKGAVLRGQSRKPPHGGYPRVGSVGGVRNAACKPVENGLQRLILSSIRSPSRQHNGEDNSVETAKLKP